MNSSKYTDSTCERKTEIPFVDVGYGSRTRERDPTLLIAQMKSDTGTNSLIPIFLVAGGLVLSSIAGSTARAVVEPQGLDQRGIRTEVSSFTTYDATRSLVAEAADYFRALWQEYSRNPEESAAEFSEKLGAFVERYSAHGIKAIQTLFISHELTGELTWNLLEELPSFETMDTSSVILEFLGQALESPNAGVRYSAAVGLGIISNENARGILEQRISKESVRTVRSAIEAQLK